MSNWSAPAIDGDSSDALDRGLQETWVDAHTTPDGTTCPTTGPLLLGLPGPVCDLCGHQLTQHGRPLTEVVPLQLANLPHDAVTTTPFQPPLACRWWSELFITERVLDAWGRSALHVGIGRPPGARSVLRGGSWPANEPIRVREAWLGPTYDDATIAAAKVAKYGGAWATWDVGPPAYGRRHPVSVARWLMDQWRAHATDRERATEPATDLNTGRASRRAEPDDDRYWQDHDGWQTAALGDRTPMYCLHCTGELIHNLDGPGSGWAHLQTHQSLCATPSTTPR